MLKQFESLDLSMIRFIPAFVVFFAEICSCKRLLSVLSKYQYSVYVILISIRIKLKNEKKKDGITWQKVFTIVIGMYPPSCFTHLGFFNVKYLISTKCQN
ncbi:hypothetical protein V8B55DRAFT_1176769 [Mucor lusitanicus]